MVESDQRCVGSIEQDGAQTESLVKPNFLPLILFPRRRGREGLKFAIAYASWISATQVSSFAHSTRHKSAQLFPHTLSLHYSVVGML